VRSLGELDQIFVYLCFNLGSIVEKSTLAKELKVAAVTVENHLQRLEDAHLIYRLPPIHLSGKKSLKPRPKIYVADPSLRNAVILRGEGVFSNEDELGTLIEGCIFKHLYAFYYPDRPRFGYWRSSHKDKEVDFVLDFPNGFRVACEVKYRENARFELKDSLNELIEHSKESNQVFLVTKNTTDYGMTEDSKVFQIPAFVFCYFLGHVELQRWLKSFNSA
jgi:predicted AAA+ superfamily ATPase